MSKVKLSDLVVDDKVQVRRIDPMTVSEYKQAALAGAQFPALVVEKDTMRIVCGNQRYAAFKRAFGKDYEVECTFETYVSDLELIKRAAKDNVTHGKRLQTFDYKNLIALFQQHKMTVDEMQEILNLPVKKIQTLGEMTVVVTGKKEKGKYVEEKRPVKRGLEHLSGTKVQEEQYLTHLEKDRGLSATSLANQLKRWLENDWIDIEDQRAYETLFHLKTALDDFFERHPVEEAAE